MYHLVNTLRLFQISEYLPLSPFFPFSCLISVCPDHLHLCNEFLFPFCFLISCSLASIFTFTASASQRFWCVSCYSCSPMSTTIRLIISIVCCFCCSISSDFFFFVQACKDLISAFCHMIAPGYHSHRLIITRNSVLAQSWIIICSCWFWWLSWAQRVELDNS